MSSEDEQQQEQPIVSRRNFLIKSGYALGGLVVGGVVGSLLRTPPAPAPAPAAPEAVNYNQALMYLTQDQFRTVEAATERIFPADQNGPGAKELGVAFYIDHQLAGEWGFNARDYMQGPFYPGEKVQGYQGRLRRREIFDIGLQEMDNYSVSRFQKRFTDLSAEEQDTVLSSFQNDEVQLTTISAGGFFQMLRSSTMEGVYCDPLYGGNVNMNGWKMKKYPGNQMAYTQIIEQEAFVEIPPVSLKEHLHP